VYIHTFNQFSCRDPQSVIPTPWEREKANPYPYVKCGIATTALFGPGRGIIGSQCFLILCISVPFSVYMLFCSMVCRWIATAVYFFNVQSISKNWSWRLWAVTSIRKTLDFYFKGWDKDKYVKHTNSSVNFFNFDLWINDVRNQIRILCRYHQLNTIIILGSNRLVLKGIEQTSSSVM
jgi:hypothetical protein